MYLKKKEKIPKNFLQLEHGFLCTKTVKRIKICHIISSQNCENMQE